ncbi:MAG TPA: site-2 protease family protein, partial [Solirubrobacteraceae bacterium]|nr:site-2 protease family protein [Solirubrobacteraceae bacterium]
MPGRGNLQLGRIFGIRVGAGGSWLFVLFILIYWLSKQFHEIIGGSTTTAYAIGVAGAVGYFLSLVLHELGHALAARRIGIPVVGIDLWFFGGLLHMRRQPQSASEELKVAAAGPLVTLVLFALSIALGLLLDGASRFGDAALIRQGTTITPALALVGWMAFINGALLLFNV